MELTHDITIRGGTIVDGTGADPFEGDLAITDGLITAVGTVEGQADREVDATGHIVSPGFVDLHTHLDAQIGWDPELTPLSWHGVTTALLGNCGVTFAPCKPSDRELLAEMMETVEDIPKHAIMSGLPWTWETYGQFLDTLEGLDPSINIAGMVGHSAVRYYVMGERAVEEQASEEEKEQMADIVGQAIRDGAVGFSINRYAPHALPDGRSIPGTFADPSEVLEIAKAIGANNGLVQTVGMDFDLMRMMAETTGGRILFSYNTGAEPGNGKVASQRLDEIVEGHDMTAICQVRGSGWMFGLQAALPFPGNSWRELRGKDFAGRLNALEDDAFVARLIEDARDTTLKLPLNSSLKDVFYLGHGEVPEYGAPIEDNVLAMLTDTDESFVELFLRLSRESGGRGLFNLRLFSKNLDEVHDLFENENIFPGLGDAGAHVSIMLDAGWSTFVLSHWIRERKLYSLAEGIRRITSGPARVMGLGDRGVLAVGKRADVNVFDFERVTELQPEMVYDFPGGAPRYTQRARGYRATIVNGQINVLNDELTGVRAGQVLRHQA